jgi:hypothetical protein
VRRQWEHLRIERERAENERRLRAELADLDDEQQHSVHMCHLGLLVPICVQLLNSFIALGHSRFLASRLLSN